MAEDLLGVDGLKAISLLKPMTNEEQEISEYLQCAMQGKPLPEVVRFSTGTNEVRQLAPQEITAILDELLNAPS
jgi:hypothetical protein